MSWLPGFLWYDGQEIFNNGRTLTNVRAAQEACLLPEITLVNEDQCGCDAYFLNPTLPMGPFDDLLACLPDCITEEMLNHILAENPWHDDDVSQSDEFLGFYVTRQEGMDGRHNQRQTTPRIAWPRGSHIGPLAPTHRTISFDFIAFATSACGLDYGMMWLERQLGSQCSGGCELAEIMLRQCCPPEDDPDYGLWMLKEVGLADGPTWGEALTTRTTCHFRRANVSLYAGNPCRFGKPLVCAPFTKLWDGDAPGSIFHYSICCDIPQSNVYSYVPIVTIKAGTTETGPLIIKAFETTDAECSWNDVTPTLMDINLLSLPANSVLVVDGSTRRLFWAESETDYNDGVFEDGSSYIDAAGGFVQWAEFSCESDIVITSDTNYYSDDYPPASPAYAPTIQIELVKRSGC